MSSPFSSSTSNNRLAMMAVVLAVLGVHQVLVEVSEQGPNLSGGSSNSLRVKPHYHYSTANSTTPPRPPRLGDDCLLVFLDVGANIGVHSRFLFEPEQYPRATAAHGIFQREFGVHRDNADICAFGVEPNPAHRARHHALEQAYKAMGWRYRYIHAAVSDATGNLTFWHHTSHADKTHEEWGFSSAVWDKSDVPEVVPTLHWAEWLQFHIIERRLPTVVHGTEYSKETRDRGRVVMKVDVEGAEYVVVPSLLFSGVFCQGLDLVFGEIHPSFRGAWVRPAFDNTTGQGGLDFLTSAPQAEQWFHNLMNQYLKTLRPENCRGRWVFLDDESYLHDGVPFPKSNTTTTQATPIATPATTKPTTAPTNKPSSAPAADTATETQTMNNNTGPNTTSDTTTAENVRRLGDDCLLVFLDVGANIGVHSRFLFEPGQYPRAKEAHKIFQREFGGQRHSADICAFGVEPNPAHKARHVALEKAYQAVGWRYHYIPAAVSDANGNLTFWHHTGHADQTHEEWGFSLGAWDPTDVAEVVPTLHWAAWMQHHILERRLPTRVYGTYALEVRQRGKVVMKMDTEGAEFVVLPSLIFSGVLCHGVDYIFGEKHPMHRRSFYRPAIDNTTGRGALHFGSEAQARAWFDALVYDYAKVINPHNCRGEWHDLDDESYLHDGIPFPTVVQSTPDPIEEITRPTPEPNDARLGDGCLLVYLDVGAKLGVHTRFLLEPQRYPNAGAVRAIWNQEFGVDRHNGDVCAFGLEPNPAHRQRHLELEEAYAKMGWRYKYLPVGVSDMDGNSTFWHPRGDVTNGGFSLVQRNSTDVAEVVPTVDLSRWIQFHIVERKLPTTVHGAYPDQLKQQGRVVVKMDADGAEYAVMPGLIFSGVFCKGLDLIFGKTYPVSFMRPAIDNKTGRGVLSQKTKAWFSALVSDYANTINPHNCRGRWADLDDDDKSYLQDDVPLPTSG